MLIYNNKAIAVAEIVKAVSTIPPKGFAETLLKEIGIKYLGDHLPNNVLFDAYRVERPVNAENIKRCKENAKKHIAGHAITAAESAVCIAACVHLNTLAMSIIPITIPAIIFCAAIIIADIIAILLNTEHILRINRLLKINRPNP